MTDTAAECKARGNKHLTAGEFDEAIAAYTDAINLDPKDHVFFSNRSAAYLSKGDAASALGDGERCIALNPTWAKGFTRKGAALHALKRYEDAIETYSAGLEVSPDDAGLKSGLGEVQKIKDAQESSGGGGGMNGLFGPQMLSKLVGHPKFGPKLSDPAFMAKLKMVQSNPQLLMNDPEMMEVFQALLGGMGGGEGGDGDAMDAQEPYVPSSRPAEKRPAAAKDPYYGMSETKRNSMQAKEKGNTLYKEKKFDEALAAYDEAMAIDPENIMLLNNKAAVYIELNQIDTALQTCESILEKAKGTKFSYEDKAKVLCRMAGAHIKAKDVPAGLACYGKAQMESYDKAVERKIKTLELEEKKRKIKEYINPEEGLAAKERGNASFRDGDFPTAIKEYEDATKRDPTNAPYHNNLAAAYLKMGVFNDAKRMVEKALEIDKNYVKAWAKKGDIEFYMKEYHKSMDSYKAGLQLEPDNSLCKQGLQKTIAKVNEANADGSVDKERQAHAMADPEIQMILQDPSVRQVLTDFQENPSYAQKAMQDPVINAKIQKLISAGVLQVK